MSHREACVTGASPLATSNAGQAATAWMTEATLGGWGGGRGGGGRGGGGDSRERHSGATSRGDIQGKRLGETAFRGHVREQRLG